MERLFLKINMSKKFPVSFESLLGKKTLFYGETNTYKTTITAKFVKFLLENKNYRRNSISILDFAPKLKIINGLKIGGRIIDYYKDSINVNYYNPRKDIIPARLEAKNRKELYNNAWENYKLINEILDQYSNSLTPILIVNDLSLYLHKGKVKNIMGLIEKSETFVGNAYYGSNIGFKKDFSKIFSLKEKYRVESIIEKMDYSYSTNNFSLEDHLNT